MSKSKPNASVANVEKQWWHSGVQFQCQGSGKCCTSHGEYGFVFLTLEDRRRFAKFFKIPTGTFTKKYCQKTNGAYHLIEKKGQPDCLFLKGKSCSVYEARPTQCRTWPFWPEVMSPKTWKKEISSFCPGVGKGKIWTQNEIEMQIRLQEKMESDILSEARRN